MTLEFCNSCNCGPGEAACTDRFIAAARTLDLMGIGSESSEGTLYYRNLQQPLIDAGCLSPLQVFISNVNEFRQTPDADPS